MATTSHIYDVFLNFRGKDTRKSFTCHLYNSFEKMKIRAFMDDPRVKKGDDFFQVIAKAIEESKISLVVFSENYGSSEWCLRELVKIVECNNTKNHIIAPIFFDVTPSVVRHQNGTFKKAFDQHEERFNKEEVHGWRKALKQVAGLAGWQTADRNQSDLIEEIVRDINIKVKRVPVISIPEHLVGIDAHLSKIESYLDIKNPDKVRMLGIYGPPGVGKSTLAKVFYYKHCSDFGYRSFVERISGRIKGKYEIVELQKALLCEILGDPSFSAFHNREEGAKMIEDVLSSKRVLLVLDDVDDKQQLEKLAGGCNWFGPGSRIIITTREGDFLSRHGVDFTYEMKGMDPADSVQLVRWHALRGNDPDDQCSRELANLIVHHTKGIPSALVKLGTRLFSKIRRYRQGEVDGKNKQAGEKRTSVRKVLKEMFKQGLSLEQILREVIEDQDMSSVQEECSGDYSCREEEYMYPYSQVDSSKKFEEESEEEFEDHGRWSMSFMPSTHQPSSHSRSMASLYQKPLQPNHGFTNSGPCYYSTPTMLSGNMSPPRLGTSNQYYENSGACYYSTPTMLSGNMSPPELGTSNQYYRNSGPCYNSTPTMPSGNMSPPGLGTSNQYYENSGACYYSTLTMLSGHMSPPELGTSNQYYRNSGPCYYSTPTMLSGNMSPPGLGTSNQYYRNSGACYYPTPTMLSGNISPPRLGTSNQYYSYQGQCDSQECPMM